MEELKTTPISVAGVSTLRQLTLITSKSNASAYMQLLNTPPIKVQLICSNFAVKENLTQNLKVQNI